MELSWQAILGGFGLFMFGIKFMGDGLKSVAGDKLRDYIDRYTSKPLMAVLIGAVITVLIQSSSATTAITIGLVRAGLMKLEQAAGIVMGANIGTTVTSFLISLRIEKYALFFVFVGALLLVFGKRKKTTYIGEIVLGFGVLFYGLSIMGDALKQLKDMPDFINFAQSMSDIPILGLLAGTVMTALIQSSSAAIGVIQKIYESGAISFMAVLPFVFGSNIGTTITGVFAAMGGSLAAKRTAGIHTLFNVIGTAIGMLLLLPFASFILLITDRFNLDPMMQIAVAHIIFNVVATIVFFPFLKKMCNLVRRLIPGNEKEQIDVNIDNLDDKLPHRLPSSALEVSKQAILKMGSVVEDSVIQTRSYFNNKKPTSEDKDHIMQQESLVNSLDKKITKYLMVISKENLTDHDFQEYNLNLEVIKNFERIGDLSVNLVEFFEMVHDDRSEFTKNAIEDIEQMFDLFMHMYHTATKIYNTKDYALFQSLMEDENYMDLLEYEARQRHFERMANEQCVAAVAGSVYCDILGNLERMADHCCNIARFVVEQNGKIKEVQ